VILQTVSHSRELLEQFTALRFLRWLLVAGGDESMGPECRRWVDFDRVHTRAWIRSPREGNLSLGCFSYPIEEPQSRVGGSCNPVRRDLHGSLSDLSADEIIGEAVKEPIRFAVEWLSGTVMVESLSER
jgi:hypothetical protein